MFFIKDPSYLYPKILKSHQIFGFYTIFFHFLQNFEQIQRKEEKNIGLKKCLKNVTSTFLI